MNKLDCYKASMVIFSLSALSLSLYAGEADVLKVNAECDQQRSCRFSVTVSHSDEGWDHYANRWEVLTESGDILATRVLHHPHVNEQPFTRSLGQVKIPEPLDHVVVRAHDSTHAYGGETTFVELSFKQ